jgi:hypothetical protein
LPVPPPKIEADEAALKGDDTLDVIGTEVGDAMLPSEIAGV